MPLAMSHLLLSGLAEAVHIRKPIPTPCLPHTVPDQARPTPETLHDHQSEHAQESDVMRTWYPQSHTQILLLLGLILLQAASHPLPPPLSTFCPFSLLNPFPLSTLSDQKLWFFLYSLLPEDPEYFLLWVCPQASFTSRQLNLSSLTCNNLLS